MVSLTVPNAKASCTQRAPPYRWSNHAVNRVRASALIYVLLPPIIFTATACDTNRIAARSGPCSSPARASAA